ncbi:MAG: phosphodiester glycosidase family protein [Leptolyngbya sp. SIO4C1]|nr:phosphodiester glycosidase family protein [Leptolyngbya sp. SIO4C1]
MQYRQYRPRAACARFAGFKLGPLTLLSWALLNAVGGIPEQLKPPELAVELSSARQDTALAPLVSSEPVAQAVAEGVQSGRQIKLNGQTISASWQRRSDQIGIVDVDLVTRFGIDLRNSSVPNRQPVSWFGTDAISTDTLPAWLSDNYRYLDIAPLAARLGWRAETIGGVLEITTRPSEILAIRQGRQDWGDRVVIDLSEPAAWQVEAIPGGIKITIDAAIQQLPEALETRPGSWLKRLQLFQAGSKTVLTAAVSNGVKPRTWSLSDPNRLIVDFRQDELEPLDVAWAEGLRWQQRYVNIGDSRFPVYAFALDPRQTAISPLPIWSNASTATGIMPLISMAQQWNSAAAINAGFFNRNNQLPLGALRYNGRWISGPILGRGAIAWDDSGRLAMDRLSLSQVITTAAGQAFPVLTINSGYVQAGISLYTSDWGPTYTTLTDTETIVTVQDQRVVRQQQLNGAGNYAAAIPPDGYLLVIRSYETAATALQPGAQVSLSRHAQPSVFEQYPHVLGAGPLLIQNRQIVLNPVAEGFSTNFIQGKAPRSAIGLTADGEWLLVTMQNRVGGRGPSLQETALIMQQLGAIQALNLDGGSSSSLYLSGQLLNRDPRTAARVHNGLGLFLAD